MTPEASQAQIRNIEWELLRVLCSTALAASARREALAMLSGYAFNDPIRQAIFDEANRIGPERPDLLRQELPARLTRRGFPAVDFDSLFAPPSLTTEQALEKARALLESAGRL
ncbi:MAG: hypothetical protein ACRD4D_01035 [Candidatus Acidiferrales bacterium]